MGRLNIDRSKEMFERAKQSVAGGSHIARVINPEIFPEMVPLYIKRAKGSHLYDIDGNDFIEYHMAFGPIILGHAHQKVNEAVREQLEEGVLYSLNHEHEAKLCEKLTKIIPCAERVRLTTSGSAATGMAVRIARAYTGKTKIIKFEGHYHGWFDFNMVGNTFTAMGFAAGGEKAPFKTLTTEGVPESVLQEVTVLPWNDSEILEKEVKRHGDEIAAIITEPYMCNWGIIPPEEGYLKNLREITEENGIVFILDEVITGFRFGLKGAQGIYGITPDLSTFAKAMANGFPIAAVVGKEEFMKPVSEGRVWIAGTYPASPICAAASLATIEELESGDAKSYKHLYNVGEKLLKGIRDAIEDEDVQAIVQGPGPAFCILFTPLEKIRSPREIVKTVNSKRAATFHLELMKRGIFVFPMAWLRSYMCTAHTEEDVEKTVEAVEESLKEAKKVQ